MADFEEEVEKVILREGGYSNHKADRGGATNYGITQRTYAFWARKHGIAWRDIKSITRAEAITVYLDIFWVPSKCDLLPSDIRDIHFDSAVNYGVGRASKMLQAVLGVDQDGAIGPATLAAARAMSTALLRARYLVARYRFYESIVNRDRSQLAFIAGWLNRLADFSQ
jgi:lysozyme family protein